MLLLATCFTFLELIVNIDAILNDPRSVNVALETVLAFNNRDNDKNIKFIDEFQKFLSKVRETVANTGRRNNKFKTGQQKSFKHEEELKFTEFIKKLIDILKNYDEEDLIDVFAVIDDEIRKYHYKGCKFYELLSNHNVRRYVADTLYQVKDMPGKVLKKKLDGILQAIEDAKYDSKQTEIIDYIDSLYTKQDVTKLKNVLDNFDMYKVKSKRANVDITKMVRDSLRSVFFDHYSNLNKVIRQDVKNNLQEFIINTVYDPDERKPKAETSAPTVTTQDKANSVRETSVLPKQSIVPNKIHRDWTSNVISFDFKLKDKEKVNFEIGKNNPKSSEWDAKISDSKNQAVKSGDGGDITDSKENLKSKTNSNEFTDQTINIADTINIHSIKTDITRKPNHHKKRKSSKKKHKLRDRKINTEATTHEITKRIKHKKKLKKDTVLSSSKQDLTFETVHVTEIAGSLELPIQNQSKNFHYIPLPTKKLKKKKNIKKHESYSIVTVTPEKEPVHTNPPKSLETNTNNTFNFQSLQNFIKKMSNHILIRSPTENVKSEFEDRNEGFVGKYNKKKSKHRKEVFDVNDKTRAHEESFDKLTKKKRIVKKEAQRHKKIKKQEKKSSKIEHFSSIESMETELSTKSKKENKDKGIEVERRERKSIESPLDTSGSAEDNKLNVASKINAINQYIQNLYTTPSQIKRTKGLTNSIMKSDKIRDKLKKRKREPISSLYISRSAEYSDGSDKNPVKTNKQQENPRRKNKMMDIPIKAYMAKNYRTYHDITPTTRRTSISSIDLRRLNDKDKLIMKTNPKPFIALEDFQRMNKEIEKLERESPKDLLEDKFGVKPQAKELFWKDPMYGDDKKNQKFGNPNASPTLPELSINAFEPMTENNAEISTSNKITKINLTAPKSSNDGNKKKLTQKQPTTPNLNVTRVSNDHRTDLDSFLVKTNKSLLPKLDDPTDIPIIFETTLSYQITTDDVKNINDQEHNNTSSYNVTTTFINVKNITNYDYYGDVNFNVIENITNQEDFEKFMDYEYTTAVTRAKRIKQFAPDYKDPQEILDTYDKNVLNAYKSMKEIKDPLLGDLAIIGGNPEDFDKTLPTENSDRAFIFNATITRH